MSGDQATYATITGLLLEKLDLHTPGVNTDLLESGLLDSLGLVELTVQLEDTFGITIPMDKLHIDNFRSVAAIAELVANRQSALTPAANSPGIPSQDMAPESNATV